MTWSTMVWEISAWQKKPKQSQLLCFINRWELNFRQTIWDKTLVLLGTSWGTHLGTLWEFQNPLKTWWQHYGHIGNKGKKQKIPLPLHTQKEKNWTTHECMLSLPIGWMNFLYPKLFVTIFLPKLMASAKILGHSSIIFLKDQNSPIPTSK